MDIFIEQLVRKKKTKKEYIRMGLCALGAVCNAVLFLVLFQIPFIGAFALFICFGLMYLLYMALTGTNLEYEYSFTNGVLDVDKIINLRKRKKLAEIYAKNIEAMASGKTADYQRLLADRGVRKIYASTMEAEDLYYILFFKDGVMTMLIFNPNQEIRESFFRYNPKKVHLDDKNGN